MKSVDEIRGEIQRAKSRLPKLESEVRTLADKATLSSGGEDRFDRQAAALQRLRAEIVELEADYRAAVETGIGDGSLTRIHGDARSTEGPKLKGRGPTLLSRAYSDPWDFQRSRFGDDPTEVRDRALSVLERGDRDVDRGVADDTLPIADEDRANVDKLLRADPDGDVAEYVIASSRPAYASAFSKLMTGRTLYMSDEERDALRQVDETRIRRESGESRAALTLTNASAMIPYWLDPTWIITGAGAVNPYRAICKTVQIPTQTWRGVSVAQLSAEFTSEASEVTDASPVISGPTITPVRADCYVQASYEVIGDSQFTAEIGAAFADAKNTLEVNAFANGTGSTQPYGLVTRMSLTTASRVASNTNGAFGAVDVFALVTALPARFQNKSSWTCHWGVANLIRQMSPSGVGSNFWIDMGPSNDGQQLLGAPLHLVSAMQSALSTATASNDDGIIILGDYSRMVVVDRLGLEVTATPVYGANLRPILSTGYTAWWRVGSDVSDANAFRSIRC